MADLRWNSINANFNDANSAMGNSLAGISQAGTVFGDVRKTILAQEQNAIDNAYREQAFNEQMRQFGLSHKLEIAKHELDKDEFNLRGDEFKINREAADMLADEYKGQQDYANNLRILLEDQKVLEKDLSTAKANLKNYAEGTPEYKAAAQVVNTAQERVNANSLDSIRLTAAINSGSTSALIGTVEDASTQSRELQLLNKTAKKDAATAALQREQSNKDITDKNLGSIKDADTKVAALRLMSDLQKSGVSSDELATMSYLLAGEDTNFWFNPNTSVENFIDQFRDWQLQNPGKTKPDNSPAPKRADLSTLTPSGLAWAEQQALEGAPSLDGITAESPLVKEEREKLRLALYGSMPEKNLSEEEKADLNVRAMRAAEEVIEQQRRQRIQPIENERTRRLLERTSGYNTVAPAMYQTRR